MAEESNLRFWSMAFPIAIAIAFLFPTAAFADVGIPMLALMAVPMWLSLLIVIPIEAYVAKQELGLNARESIRIAGLANLASTFLGIPVTWAILAILEIAGSAVLAWLASIASAPGQTISVTEMGVWSKLLIVFFTSAWLLPFDADLYWMIPTAALLLCVPFFYASVWCETAVAKKFVSPELYSKVGKWAWRANLYSYALMVLVIVGLFVASAIRHQTIKNDDEHRNVDLVSADRLWQVAVQRKTRRKKQLASITSSAHQDDDSETFARSRKEIGEFISSGNLPEAKKLLEASVSAEDERLENNKYRFAYPAYDLRLGTVNEKLGDFAAAQKFYEHVLARTESFGDNDCSSEALLAYADLCLHEHQIQRAESLYKQATISHSFGNHHEQASKKLAEFYCSQKRNREAEAMLHEAIKNVEKTSYHGEFPNHSEDGILALALANCYLADGNLTSAEHWIKQTLRGDEAISEAATAYAELLKRRGQAGESNIWLNRAIETADKQ